MKIIAPIWTVAALMLWPAGSPAALHAQDRPAETTPGPPATKTPDHAGHRTEPQDDSARQDPAPARARAGRRPITDAERAAAFPDVQGHSVHDDGVNFLVLFDRLEWQRDDGDRLAWDAKGWVGGDVHRVWFRSAGAGAQGDVTGADAHLLLGRAISPWWDVVVGVRQDVGPGSPQAWGAIGLQGLAPYWFDVEATAYVGADWRTDLRVDTELDVRVTNRLVFQPHVEIAVHGKSDPERGVGSGLGSLDAGLRLRYEVRRELAPYVGIVWASKFLGTADLAEAAGDPTHSIRLAVGLRAWF
jgi:copper resistance protein B